MDRVAELLARLESLEGMTDEELAALESDLRALYDELREGDLDASAVQALGQLADGLDQINGENTRREEERVDLARNVEQLDARMSGEQAAPEGEVVEDDAEEEPAEDDTDEEVEVIDAEVVLAGAVPGRARVRVPRSSRPVETPTTDGVRILAAPDLPGRAAGANFTDWDDVAVAMCERLGTFRGAPTGDVQNVPVGRVEWDRPEERTLGQELLVNQHRINAVTSIPAIIASGGICGPLPVQYGVQADVSAARPVRDSLPSFTASRGGMQWQAPVGIGDADPSAIGALTAAQDAAGNVTKSIWCIPCSPAQSVTVDAIYERLCFSNFSDRYNPENMRAYQDVTRGAWARFAERRLLASMRAQATACTAPALTVNSMRALNLALSYARAWYEDRYRVPEGFPLQTWLPGWLADMVAVDMSWQAPGDNTIGWTDSDVEAIFSRWQTRVTWTMESDLTGQDLTGITTPAFNYPGHVQMLIAPVGSYTFLDGGTLDFGIVRDSTTNAKNRFETFFESFEAVARTGYPGLNINVPICLNGAAAALATQATCANTGT